MDGQSLTELKGGSGGGNTNWKTLSDVKTEHLGHGDKVHTYSDLTHSNILDMVTDILLFKDDSLKIFKDKLKGRC